MLLIRGVILAMVALSFLPATLAAQGPRGDAGEFVIMNAQYGTMRNHVDVTNRLKELARTDRPFRANNENFGDPDPGQRKMLRIYARGPNGRERMFEYAENAIVDGAQFSSWSRGEWGGGKWSGDWQGNPNHVYDSPRGGRDSGEYVIISAQYGTLRRHADVTQRLKDLARADRPFRANNENFGDPAPGERKVLRIYARGPRGPRTFEFTENSIVDGAQFSSWTRGDWNGGKWNGKW